MSSAELSEWLALGQVEAEERQQQLEAEQRARQAGA